MSALTQFFGGSGGGSGIPVRGLLVTGGWGGTCDVFYCKTGSSCICTTCCWSNYGIQGLRGGFGGRVLSFKQFVSPGVTVPITVGYAGTSRGETYNFCALGYCNPSPAGVNVWDRNNILYLGTEGGSSCFGACAYVKVDPPKCVFSMNEACTVAGTIPPVAYKNTIVHNKITYALDGKEVKDNLGRLNVSDGQGFNYLEKQRQHGVFDNPVLFDRSGAGNYVISKAHNEWMRENGPISGNCRATLGGCLGGEFPNVISEWCYGATDLLNKCSPTSPTIYMGLAAIRMNGAVNQAEATDWHTFKTTCVQARGYAADWFYGPCFARIKRNGITGTYAYRSACPLTNCDFPSGLEAISPCPGEYSTSITNHGLQSEILGTISSFGMAGTGLQATGREEANFPGDFAISNSPTGGPDNSGSCCCHNLRALTDANSPMHQCTGHGNGAPAFMPADVPCISPYRPISASTTADTGTVIIQYPTDYNAATVSSPNVCNCSPQTPGCYTYRFLAPGSITFP